MGVLAGTHRCNDSSRQDDESPMRQPYSAALEGTNTIDTLRDLELGNEVRKVLARMLFKVLDEVCQHESHGLCHAQQAFVTGRDIIRNTTMLCRNFWAAHEEAAEGDDPYLLFALDCSKGYNRMDHSWLQRCLRQASTLPEILAIVESLLINMPVHSGRC